MLDEETLNAALQRLLPPDLQEQARILARHIVIQTSPNHSEKSGEEFTATKDTSRALKILSGQELEIQTSTVAFGEGNQVGDISIRDIASRDITTINVNIISSTQITHDKFNYTTLMVVTILFILTVSGFLLSTRMLNQSRSEGATSLQATVVSTLAPPTATSIPPTTAVIPTTNTSTPPPNTSSPSTITPLLQSVVATPSVIAENKPNIEIMQSDQMLITVPSNFLVTLKQIELTPVGAMRWTFEGWNKTAKRSTFAITPNSYVTDDNGNRYNVIEQLELTLDPGVRGEGFVIFEEPKAPFSQLSLFIVGFSAVRPQNPAVTINQTFTGEPPIQATATITVDGRFQINKTLVTIPSEFLVTLKSIELLPNNTMRWAFEGWNNTTKRSTFAITPGSYITDDTGKRYNVIEQLELTLDPGVQEEKSALFEGGTEKSSELSLHITGFSAVRPQDPAITVTLPKS